MRTRTIDSIARSSRWSGWLRPPWLFSKVYLEAVVVPVSVMRCGATPRGCGDVIEVAIGTARWRIGFRLTPAALTLREAPTGEPLCCAPLTDVGISYRNGTYYPEDAEREVLFTAYVLPWITLIPRQ